MPFARSRSPNPTWSLPDLGHVRTTPRKPTTLGHARHTVALPVVLVVLVWVPVGGLHHVVVRPQPHDLAEEADVLQALLGGQPAEVRATLFPRHIPS